MADLDMYFLIGAVVFGALSEIIGMNPKWKSNSVIQGALAVGAKLFKKKE